MTTSLLPFCHAAHNPFRAPAYTHLERVIESRLLKHPAGNMVVVEIPLHAKGRKAVPARKPCHLPDALNAQLLTGRIRRRKQHLYLHLTSDRWATCTANERAVESNIASKAAIRVPGTVIPVEDDREPQPVSHGRPSFGTDHSRGKVPHTNSCGRQRTHTPCTVCRLGQHYKPPKVSKGVRDSALGQGRFVLFAGPQIASA